MKTFVIVALTVVFVSLLLLGVDAMYSQGPGLAGAAICGVLGCFLAQAAYGLVGRYVVKKRPD
jgi:hypothetical protein